MAPTATRSVRSRTARSSCEPSPEHCERLAEVDRKAQHDEGARLTAPSQLEQFADVAGGYSQLVQTGSTTNIRPMVALGRVVRAAMP
jgi:hypothetical protein